MTLVDNFCQLYEASKRDAAMAVRLAPRLAEIWNDMPEDDRSITRGLLGLTESKDTEDTNA